MWNLWQLIMACSLAHGPGHAHVEDVLYRVIMATSQGNPLAIHDATTHAVYTPSGPREAAQIIDGLRRQGHALHIGLAALSEDWRTQYKLSGARALDSCANVGVASLALEEVLSPAAQRDDDALHAQIATYWSPRDPTSVDALTWGARVLMVSPVDVSAQAQAAAPRPAPTYMGRARMFFDGGAPDPTDEATPTKWEAPPHAASQTQPKPGDTPTPPRSQEQR